MTRAGASAAITPRWRMVRRCAAGWPSCGRGELVDELRRGLNPPGDWLDETNGRRLENAAAALEALHRPRQARALWQRLAFSDDVHATEDQREQARAALA